MRAPVDLGVHMRRFRSSQRLASIGVAVIAAVLLPQSAHASSAAADFEPPTYSTGTVNGQDGWSSLGAAGSGCAVYDHAVVANSYGYATFGDQSLRISNAVTSGCFGDQTFSKSNADEAGESGAFNGGLSGGTRQTHFEAEWDFASTTPGAEQPGASVVASPDRGDGARMGWVQMTDTPTGLQVNFYDFQVPSGDIDGACDSGAFIFTAVAGGLSRTTPHTVKISMDFADGPGNDLVRVYVDGVLVHNGTSWEDYFRECQPPGTRTVDSILFRTGGTAVPATAGNGFLIDNLDIATSTVSGTADMVDADGYLDATEVASGSVPANWVGSAEAVSAEVWFEDSTAAIPSGCGPFIGGPSGSGSVNATCAANLPQGAFYFKAQFTDAVGNTSAIASDSLIKDTAGPAAPTVSIDTDPIGSLNQAAVAISGTTEPNADVDVTLTDSGTGSVSGSDTADGAGAYSVTLDASGLADGTLTATATATDPLGNIGSSGNDTALKDTVADAGTLAFVDGDGYINAAEALTNVPATWDGPSDAASASVWFTDSVGAIPSGCGPWATSPDGVGALPTYCTVNLPDGTIHFRGTWTDGLGNVSTEGSTSSILDRLAPAAPTVSIDTSLITSANDGAVPISGSTEPGASVNVTLTDEGTGSASGSDVADGSGAYSMTIDASGLADGTITATASATDVAGNAGGDTATDTAPKDSVVTGTVDIVDADGFLDAAEVAAGDVPANWTGSASAVSAEVWFEDATATIPSGCGPFFGGPNGNGWINSTCAANLPQGEFFFKARFTDSIGNTSAIASDSLIKDTVGPDAPTVSIDTDPVTSLNEETVEISGTTEPNAVVNVTVTDTDTDTGEVVGNDEADGTGAFALTINASGLSDGVLTATAIATDTLGNEGAVGADTALKDTVAPEGSVVMLDPNSDGFMNAAEAAAGTIPANWSNDSAEAVSAQVWFEDADGTPLKPGCGPWAVGPTGAGAVNSSCAASLAQGVFAFKGQWTDTLGNLSPIASTTLVKDTIAPLAPVFTAPAADAVFPPGQDVTVSGTAEFGSTVLLKDGATTVGSVVASPTTGAWSFEITAPMDGVHALTATATDLASNTGPSASRSFTIDRLIPIIIRPFANSTQPGVTTISGSGKTFSTVEVYEGTTLIGSGQVGATGDWSIQTGFANGTHTIKAQGVEGATRSVFSATRTFIVDADLPQITIDNDDPAIFIGAAPVITGTATDGTGVARIEVRYINALTGARVVTTNAATCTLCGPTGTSVTWSDAPNLPPGLYRIEAVAVDVSGQRSNAAAIQSLKIV